MMAKVRRLLISSVGLIDSSVCVGAHCTPDRSILVGAGPARERQAQLAGGVSGLSVTVMVEFVARNAINTPTIR